MNPGGPGSSDENRRKSPLNGSSTTNLRFGQADRRALREIFGGLCLFASYLFVLQVFASVFNLGRLATACAQFVPYCLLMTGVCFRGWQLARRDRQSVLIAVCLACVFLVLFLDVTKNVPWFDAVPVLGRDSDFRNVLSSLAIVLALVSFPAASYFLLQEILSATHQLDEKVQELQHALEHVRRLQGLLPICMCCHKIRTDQRSWQQLEHYISEHSTATFTHSICPECSEKHFGIKLAKDDKKLQAQPEERPQTPAS